MGALEDEDNKRKEMERREQWRKDAVLSQTMLADQIARKQKEKDKVMAEDLRILKLQEERQRAEEARRQLDKDALLVYQKKSEMMGLELDALTKQRQKHQEESLQR